jgi:hypothetical protein
MGIFKETALSANKVAVLVFFQSCYEFGIAIVYTSASHEKATNAYLRNATLHPHTLLMLARTKSRNF